jgi:hypothetical protein
MPSITTKAPAHAAHAISNPLTDHLLVVDVEVSGPWW